MKKKERILNNPFLFGFSIFLLIFLGGSLAGFILGMIVMVRNPCSRGGPSDPCDGAAMAAGFIWILAFEASLVLGIMVGIVSSVVLKLKQKP